MRKVVVEIENVLLVLECKAYLLSRDMLNKVMPAIVLVNELTRVSPTTRSISLKEKRSVSHRHDTSNEFWKLTFPVTAAKA